MDRNLAMRLVKELRAPNDSHGKKTIVLDDESLAMVEQVRNGKSRREAAQTLIRLGYELYQELESSNSPT